MKKQARLQGEKVFKNPADKVIDSLGNVNNTTSSQVISTEVQTDTLRKLTFQIRDSVYRQLLRKHHALIDQLGSDAPDREVIVEELIAANLEKLTQDEELKNAIAHRQQTRQQELESGALINPSSRKRK